MVERQPTLSDGAIRLTPFSLRDVSALVEADQDREMAKRFDFPSGPPNPGSSRRAVRRWQRGWRTKRLVAFAVRPSDSPELIGGCEVRVRPDGVANVSYFTAPHHRGRGVATRAVRLLCRFAFSELRLERLEIRTEVDNVASQAVAEAAGFQHEGRLRSGAEYRSGRRDVFLYSLLPGGPG